MKLKCMVKLLGTDVCKEEIIDINEKELIGLEGYAPRNRLWIKVQNWAEDQLHVDYEIVEGWDEPELPYFDEPFRLK